MATVARETVVGIAVYSAVFTIRLPPGMLMAAGTGKGIVLVGRVAIAAPVPFTLVGPGIDGEILCVMLGEGDRVPARTGRMAFGACRGEPGRFMVRVGGSIVVFLVAGSTIRGQLPESAVRVAFGTSDLVSLREEEESMLEIGGIPPVGPGPMALDTIN